MIEHTAFATSVIIKMGSSIWHPLPLTHFQSLFLCFSGVSLTCAVHVVSGQLKQPHMLVGDGVEGAAG